MRRLIPSSSCRANAQLRGASAAAKRTTGGLQYFGMALGAAVGPFAFWLMTYDQNYMDILRPGYVPKHTKDDVGTVELVPKPSLGGPFTMTNAQDGRIVNEKDVFDGKWTLLYFGFTKCAEICPNTMKFLVDVMDEAEAKHKEGHQHQRLQTVFVTIDTVRDGSKELLDFLAKFRKDRRGLVGLYGDDEQTSEMARLWRVYFSALSETTDEAQARRAKGYATLKDAIAADDTYQFDHSAASYLIGPDGKLRDFFFREMGKDHAVDRIGLHWADAYGLNRSADDAEDDDDDLPGMPSVGVGK